MPPSCRHAVRGWAGRILPTYEVVVLDEEPREQREQAANAS